MAAKHGKNPREGAKRKHGEVRRRAAARAAARASRGEEPVQPRTEEQLLEAAEALLRLHRVKILPATLKLAKLHEQMTDAVDALYDTTVRGGKEQRQVSAMVSAGKIAIMTLERLGLPGDDLEDEEAEENEDRAEAAAEKESRTKAKTTPAPKDELEAYE